MTKFDHKRGQLYKCDACGAPKMKKDFYKRRGVKNGISAKCKLCTSEEKYTKEKKRVINVNAMAIAIMVVTRCPWGPATKRIGRHEHWINGEGVVDCQ